MVSSALERISPHLFCEANDLAFNFLPTRPITKPTNGSIRNTNMVSFQLTIIIMPRQAMIIIGYLISENKLAITEFCTSCTSPERRAMISPLRSAVKKPIGKETILSYISRLMSRTTPFCIGIVKYSLR